MCPGRARLFLCLLIASLAFWCGCDSNNSALSHPPASPPTSVSVTVSPATASVNAGATQQFTATVSNTSNTAVTWQVNGVTGGAAATGTISAGGLYTAPATPPAGTVTVTAVSQADASKSGSATVTVVPAAAVSVSVSPATASVNAGATQQFTATVSNTSNTAVTWQVNGVTGGAAATGTITAAGLYTAPQTAPSGSVTVTAISQADSSKSGSATVTVVPAAAVSVSVSPATASVNAGATQQFTATVSNTSNTAVTWQVNGVTGGAAATGTISAAGLYTAPATPPAGTVTVTAISQADSSKSGSATVTVVPAAVSVSVSPATASVNTGATQQFTATVSNTSNTAVTWQVNGVTGGSATTGTITAAGLYTAPQTPPSGSVTVTAISQADSSKSGSATVTVVPAAVSVSVSPASATVNTGATQQFTATVSNTSNTAVTWQVNGVTGGSATTGTITAAGLYTAPLVAPSGPVTVTAISQADSTKSGSASVTVVNAIVVVLSPATATVNTDQTRQFTSQVRNTTNTAVTWQVNGVTGGAAATGTISAQGLYTAPTTPPAGTVTVTAVSQADASKSGSASVTVLPAVAVSVSPASASVDTNATQQFTATVTNTSNTAVTWQVNGVTGGAITTGTITAAGLYTAPLVALSGPVTVTAISQADSSKSGSASVTVVNAIVVILSPATASVNLGLTQQFTSQVRNTTNTAVTWQVNGVSGGAAATGTISAQGLYTAPTTSPAGTVKVTALSQADTSRSGSAAVTVAPAVAITISPNGNNITVAAGATQQFTASVTNTSNTAVTWQVNGVTGGGAAVGTITAQGLYTAPAIPPVGGVVEIGAVSQADPSRSATVPVGDTYSNVSLKGTFVLSLSGFDASNHFFSALAVVTADGQADSSGFGHLSGSEEVISNGAYTGPTALAAGCCQYQVLADGRGALTITGPAGTATYALAMSSGTGAVLTDFDNGARIQGALQAQDQSAIATPLNASFAFGGPAAIGQLTFTTTSPGAGNISGTQDVIVSGAIASDLSLAGAFTAGSSGRGTAQWTSLQGAANDSFYIVDASHLVLMSTDPANPGLATATLQSAPVTALAAGDYAFTTSGQTASSPAGPLGLTGVFTLNGLGQITGGSVDGVVGTTAFTAATLSGASLTSKSNGEFSLVLAATSPTLSADYAVWMASPSVGYMLEADNNGNSTGALALQQGAPFGATALNGVFAFRLAGSPAAGQTVLQQGWITFGSNGAALGSADLMVDGIKAPGQSFTATYASTDSSLGRFTATLTFPSVLLSGSAMTVKLAGYIIAPTGTPQSPALGSSFLVQADSSQNWSGELFQQH